MTPDKLIIWAVAVGIAYAVLSFFIPFEKWAAALVDAVKSRRRKRPGSGEPSGD